MKKRKVLKPISKEPHYHSKNSRTWTFKSIHEDIVLIYEKQYDTGSVFTITEEYLDYLDDLKLLVNIGKWDYVDKNLDRFQTGNVQGKYTTDSNNFDK